ncbi:hypothetical protein [Paraburkholderia pallida]|uniref:Uncharacterized protein n=1 Tax=Paraburkholderia pallida TaxID=2547399 RepID=A0A4P7D931_9BURK|nr:hypothetical protein [Paraburkholderia pallida]QBR03710.1 hypothetical protein E1956_42200 [Paraburkholderia pallida]
MTLSQWDSYRPASHEPGVGCISEDALGRWHLSVTVKVKKGPRPPTGEIGKSEGLDLSLKDFAATSDGRVVTREDQSYKLSAALVQQ